MLRISKTVPVIFMVMLYTKVIAFTTQNNRRVLRQMTSVVDGRIQFMYPYQKQRAANPLFTTTDDDNETKSDDTTNTKKSVSYKTNKKNLDDQLLSAISGNGEIKVTACTIRNLVNDAMLQHSLTATSADALARSMASCLLLSNGMQEEQTFQLTLDCTSGPIRQVVCIATGDATVKGYVGNPQLADMHISEALGTKGSVQVVKMHPEWRKPYNGITAMMYGDVDRDLGTYLAESEQRACALAASSLYKGILCTSAGAYMVEQLPGCTDATTKQVEVNLGQLLKENSDAAGDKPLPAGLLEQGTTPHDICERILDGLDMQLLEERSPALVCNCSEDRLFRAIKLLPRADVDEILEKDKRIEARCDFCGTTFRMEAEQVYAELEAAAGDPSSKQ